MQIALVQHDPIWEDPVANRSMLEEMIWQINDPVDLILLPEMFTTGFSMNARDLAEPINFHTFKWMRQMASQKNALVMGSYIVSERGKYFNRLVAMFPDGHWEHYDKRHLFRMGNEHLHYTPGQASLLITWRGWNLFPQICYDLRFPVWSRNTGLQYDLFVNMANWPTARIHVWDTFLKARAMENLCYVAGVNRCGTDGVGVSYPGHSIVVDFKGNEIKKTRDLPGVTVTEINKEELIAFREKFPTHLDADSFSLS